MNHKQIDTLYERYGTVTVCVNIISGVWYRFYSHRWHRSSFHDFLQDIQRDFPELSDIKEVPIAEKFYDANFLEKLDSDINKLGFNNGVYDISTQRIRPGIPSDMVSITTGNNYSEHNECSDPQIAKLKQDLIEMKPEARDYVLHLLANWLIN